MKTREELIEILKEYKGIFSDEIYEYLLNIIDLEYSAVRDDIVSLDIKTHLNELEIYKLCVIYNIYTRTLNIIKNEFININSLIFPVDYEPFNYMDINIVGGIHMFRFAYGKSLLLNEDDYCKISLYDHPKIEEEIDSLKSDLKNILFENEMFDKTSSTLERIKRLKKIAFIKEKITELENDRYKNEKNMAIEFANHCNEVIANDYGLPSRKCLIIRKPGITIEQHKAHII